MEQMAGGRLKVSFKKMFSQVISMICSTKTRINDFCSKVFLFIGVESFAFNL